MSGGGNDNQQQPGFPGEGGTWDSSGNFFPYGSSLSTAGNQIGVPFNNGLGAYGPSAGGATGGGSSLGTGFNYGGGSQGSMEWGYPTDGSGISSGNGGSSSNNGGFSFSQIAPFIGQIISAYGAYKSTASNEKNAAGGPVLPQDVRAPRNALSDAFLQMILTPGGLNYGATPFNLDIGEGSDPFAAVNKYRTASQPLFDQELTKGLDAERAKLGGQYGIRFGTDLQRGLGETVSQATAGREASLGQLGISSYDSFMQRRMAELGLRTDDYRKQQYGLLPIVANYLSGQPSSSPFQGGSPMGQALQGLGGGLSNFPIMQYFAQQNNNNNKKSVT